MKTDTKEDMLEKERISKILFNAMEEKGKARDYSTSRRREINNILEKMRRLI